MATPVSHSLPVEPQQPYEVLEQDLQTTDSPEVRVEQIELREKDKATPHVEQNGKGKSKATKKRQAESKSSEDIKSTKTVVKNYGKAIASFAISNLATPYLNPLIKKEGIRKRDFTQYIGSAKETIEGIDTFRALLLSKDGDTKKIIAFKKIFQNIGEIFIKYFSVNWIFNGKMQNKLAHLKFRFKMLRRIQNPEQFTYLK